MNALTPKVVKLYLKFNHPITEKTIKEPAKCSMHTLRGETIFSVEMGMSQ